MFIPCIGVPVRISGDHYKSLFSDAAVPFCVFIDVDGHIRSRCGWFHPLSSRGKNKNQPFGAKSAVVVVGVGLIVHSLVFPDLQAPFFELLSHILDN